MLAVAGFGSIVAGSLAAQASAVSPGEAPSQGQVATQAEAASQDEVLGNYQQFGFSTALEMKNYLTLKDFKVQETTVKLDPKDLEALVSAPVYQRAPSEQDLINGSAGTIIDVLTNPDVLTKWVTIGQKLWQVIASNKPVANVSTQRISVVPVAQNDWSAMENWKGPAIHSYTITAKNLYGATVISHTYTVAYNYGGQVDGKGAFLANATVIPTDVDVSWGFTLNSAVEVGQAVNVSTKDNPTPGVDLQVKWTMDSVLKHLEGRDSFFVRGDGQMSHFAGGR